MTIRPDEEWAKRIIERELGEVVHLNDDGTENSQFDLRIGERQRPSVAIEVSSAVDGRFLEAWKLGPASGPFQTTLRGDWHVIHTSSARIKGLLARVTPVLRVLEEKEVPEGYPVPYSWLTDETAASLVRLGVDELILTKSSGEGKVQFGMPGFGGAVNEAGQGLGTWLGDFIAGRLDVVEKLQRSNANECHLFIPVDFLGAPWHVFSYLTGKLEQFPAEAPPLPSPITNVWLAPKFGDKGIRWDGEVWNSFLLAVT